MRAAPHYTTTVKPKRALKKPAKRPLASLIEKEAHILADKRDFSSLGSLLRDREAYHTEKVVPYTEVAKARAANDSAEKTTDDEKYQAWLASYCWKKQPACWMVGGSWEATKEEYQKRYERSANARKLKEHTNPPKWKEVEVLEFTGSPVEGWEHKQRPPTVQEIFSECKYHSLKKYGKLGGPKKYPLFHLSLMEEEIRKRKEREEWNQPPWDDEELDRQYADLFGDSPLSVRQIPYQPSIDQYSREAQILDSYFLTKNCMGHLNDDGLYDMYWRFKRGLKGKTALDLWLVSKAPYAQRQNIPISELKPISKVVTRRDICYNMWLMQAKQGKISEETFYAKIRHLDKFGNNYKLGEPAPEPPLLTKEVIRVPKVQVTRALQGYRGLEDNKPVPPHKQLILREIHDQAMQKLLLDDVYFRQRLMYYLENSQSSPPPDPDYIIEDDIDKLADKWLRDASERTKKEWPVKPTEVSDVAARAVGAKYSPVTGPIPKPEYRIRYIPVVERTSDDPTYDAGFHESRSGLLIPRTLAGMLPYLKSGEYKVKAVS